ncbi:MAG: iron-containing alcohol dehydrogenase, partial [Spirochaetota bacterium]
WGITLAHNGWVKTGVKYAAPMHLIGHVLSARYDIPHGVAMSIIMPAWMKIACASRTEKFAQFATRVFGARSNDSGSAEMAASTVALFEEHLRKSGVPVRLSMLPGLHWEDEELLAIRDDVVRISFDETGLLPGNPKISSDELYQLLRNAR